MDPINPEVPTIPYSLTYLIYFSFSLIFMFVCLLYVNSVSLDSFLLLNKEFLNFEFLNFLTLRGGLFATGNFLRFFCYLQYANMGSRHMF